MDSRIFETIFKAFIVFRWFGVIKVQKPGRSVRYERRPLWESLLDSRLASRLLMTFIVYR